MENPELIEKKFSILQEISKAIVVTDNINAVADLTLDLAINYTNAEKGSLMLVNEDDELYILAARGSDSGFHEYREKIGQGIAGIVAKNRCPVLVEDIDSDSRFSSKKRNHYKNKSFISCPIICKNRLLGVFNINDKKNGEHFIIDDFALLDIIANQAAITIENALLLKQLRSKAAELEEINKKLIESDEAKNEFIIRISHELRTPLNSIKGSIYYLGENRDMGRQRQKEFFEIITNGVNELRNSVEHLLNFLRREDDTRATKISHTPSDPA